MKIKTKDMISIKMEIIKMKSDTIFFNFFLGMIYMYIYESPEGTWRFSKKAIRKLLYRIVQSVLTD